MAFLSSVKNNKYLFLVLVFSLFSMGAVFFLFGFQRYSDSQGYIDAIHWFQGKQTEVSPWRILRPLPLFLALPFECFGDGAGLIIQNIFFYFLAVILVFKITKLVFKDEKQAFWASLFFVTATPIIDSGLALLTDMGAWFFYLLSIFLTLTYFTVLKNDKLIAANGFLTGLGVLAKESAGVGSLFFGLMVLLEKELNIKEKIIKVLKFALFFMIPVAITQILMFKRFNFTLLDWYSMGRAGAEQEGFLLAVLRYLGQLFRILGILWFFILIGVWRILKEKNKEIIKICVALIPSSFSFLLWTTGGGGRAAFIFAPLGVLLASKGWIFFSEKIKNKRQAALCSIFLVFLILTLNFTFCRINSQVPFVDKIMELLKN